MTLTPRLSAILIHWREHGLPCESQPKVIEELGAGLSNQSFLLQADKERWVLRLDSTDAEALGISREREHRIHQLVADEGLAPTCITANRELGFFITEYIEQESIFKPRRKGEQLNCLHRFFARLHKLSLDLRPFDYASQLKRLSGYSNLPTEVLNALECVEADTTLGICHHDPNPNNIMFTQGKVLMIDWEYAALGNPIIDLAGLVQECSFTIKEISEKFTIDPDLLQAGITLYTAMSRYWSLEMQRLKSS